ncbi:MAG: CHRD domain-containing protein [Nitrososphaeraceae archaeon]
MQNHKALLLFIVISISFFLYFNQDAKNTIVYAAIEGKFKSDFSGDNVVPKIKNTNGFGSAIFQISETSFSYQINVMNVKNIISIDLHKGIEGINGPVVLNLYQSDKNNEEFESNLDETFDLKEKIRKSIDQFRTISYIPVESTSSLSISGTINIKELEGPLKGKNISELFTLMQSDQIYISVNSEKYPDGELRGQVKTVN